MLDLSPGKSSTVLVDQSIAGEDCCDFTKNDYYDLLDVIIPNV